MSIRQTIIERRSIKQFNGKKVEKETVLRLIEDAAWAPNHGNREPWRFVITAGEDQSAVHTLLRDLVFPNWQTEEPDALAKKMEKFTLPGAYAFVIVPEDARQKERLEDYAAASMLIQNMQLLGWEDGIGMCWKTPGFLDNPKFRTALNVQNGERVIAMLQIGYFDQMPPAKPRKDVAQIVSVFGE